MGKSQRDKGARGEREVANAFRLHGFQAKRMVGQFQSGSNAPDVLVEKLPFLWIESKFSKQPRIEAAIQQAREAAPSSSWPIAVTRRNGEKALVTMSFDAFMRLLGKAYPEAKEQLELPMEVDNGQAEG